MKNVRQTLRMAALTAVLASAPMTLPSAIASADFERVTPNAPSPIELAGFVPAPACRRRARRPPTRRPRRDVAPVADVAPAPADLPPAPDAPPAPAPEAPPAPAPDAPPRSRAPRLRPRRLPLRLRAPEAAPAPDAPEPEEAPAPVKKAYSVNWDAIAACESGGNWGISTGNGYAGGLQFTPEHLARQRRFGFGERREP